jgi:hypothetical protein
MSFVLLLFFAYFHTLVHSFIVFNRLNRLKLSLAVYPSVKFAFVNETQLVYLIPNCPTNVQSVAVFLQKWAKEEASSTGTSIIYHVFYYKLWNSNF